MNERDEPGDGVDVSKLAPGFAFPSPDPLDRPLTRGDLLETFYELASQLRGRCSYPNPTSALWAALRDTAAVMGRRWNGQDDATPTPDPDHGHHG